MGQELCCVFYNQGLSSSRQSCNVGVLRPVFTGRGKYEAHRFFSGATRILGDEAVSSFRNVWTTVVKGVLSNT